MASFITRTIFDELGLTEPTTEKEFFAVLDKIKADGKYVPLAIGSKELWEAESMGYTNFGPNYWEGEKGPPGFDCWHRQIHRS